MELNRYLSGLGMFAVLAISPSSPEAALVTHYDASALPPITDGTQVLTLTDISGHGNDARRSSSAAMGATYVAGGIGARPSLLFTRDSSGGVNTGNAPGYQSLLSMGKSFGISGHASFTEIFVFRSAGNISSDDNLWSHVGGLGTGAPPHSAAFVEIQGNRLDIATGFSNDATLGSSSYDRLANKDLVLTVIHQGCPCQAISNSFQVFANGSAPGQGLLSGLSIGATGDANEAFLNLTDAPLSIAGSPVGMQEGFGGLLSEVLIYNTALSATDRHAIESLLMEKYGIPAVPEPTIIAILTMGILSLLGYRACSLRLSSVLTVSSSR